MRGYSSVGYSNGFPNTWANIFVQSLGPAGVDGLLGKCGTVDHFFDYFFGTKCGKSSLGKVAPQVHVTSGLPQGLPQLPRLTTNLPPLPCTVTDLVHSVLGESVRCTGR